MASQGATQAGTGVLTAAGHRLVREGRGPWSNRAPRIHCTGTCSRRADCNRHRSATQREWLAGYTWSRSSHRPHRSGRGCTCTAVHAAIVAVGRRSWVAIAVVTRCGAEQQSLRWKPDEHHIEPEGLQLEAGPALLLLKAGNTPIRRGSSHVKGAHSPQCTRCLRSGAVGTRIYILLYLSHHAPARQSI